MAKKNKKWEPIDPAQLLKSVSKTSRDAVKEFDASAQVWGWENDQGTGSSVHDAFVAYQQDMERLIQRIAKLEKQAAQGRLFRSALKWALGEGGTFPQRLEGQGQYWFRRELRERAQLKHSRKYRG